MYFHRSYNIATLSLWNSLTLEYILSMDQCKTSVRILWSPRYDMEFLNFLERALGGVTFWYAPIFQCTQKLYKIEYMFVGILLGMCITSFSMYCATQIAYKDGASVYICTTECYTGV